MNTFEKSVVVVITTVWSICLIALLVISSITMMRVYSNPQPQNQPHIYRDRHGNLEIDIPDSYEEPPIPRYRNPLGSKTEKKSDE